jgi:hypothetical protein
MNHRLVRSQITVGSHDISVPTYSKSPRLYTAYCKTCQKTLVAPTTGTKADASLIAHRDETIAIFVEAQLAELTPAPKKK